MKTLTLRELLERARAILVDTKDGHLAAAAQPKQASPTLDLCKMSQSGLNRFRCRGPNHLAMDCTQCSSVRNQRERSTMRCYLYNKTGHHVKNCPENRNRGRVTQRWVNLIRKTAEPLYNANWTRITNILDQIQKLKDEWPYCFSSTISISL